MGLILNNTLVQFGRETKN